MAFYETVVEKSIPRIPKEGVPVLGMRIERVRVADLLSKFMNSV